ncbi:MAG: GNAT family N-acetyltransferase [Bryobacteraceae bacterium]
MVYSNLVDHADLATRPALESDLEAIAALQAAAPEASQWSVRDYLGYDCLVALRGVEVVGFAVSRSVAEGEWELLNLAVAPAARRLGVGRALLTALTARRTGTVFLEVRAANIGARRFYEDFGFQLVTTRFEYYDNPSDSAIVMKFHSW